MSVPVPVLVARLEDQLETIDLALEAGDYLRATAACKSAQDLGNRIREAL